MLMRSVTPAHGVGRFASTRGACVAVKPAGRDEHQDGPDRVAPEPPAERRGPEPDGEQDQEAVRARDDDVHRVGARPLAPSQRLASMHREARRGEVARGESHEQRSRDAQRALATGARPDAQPERDQQRAVRREQRDHDRSRGCADGRQLAHGVRGEAVVAPAPGPDDVGRDVQRRGQDPAAEQDRSRHRSAGGRSIGSASRHQSPSTCARRELRVDQEVVAPQPLDDLVARRSRVGERRQQRHHARRVVPREIAALPLVDPAVDAGLDVVDPQLRSKAGEPGEQRRVQDALPAERGMQRGAAAERGESELDDQQRRGSGGCPGHRGLAEDERRRAVREPEPRAEVLLRRGQAMARDEAAPRPHAAGEVSQGGGAGLLRHGVAILIQSSKSSSSPAQPSSPGSHPDRTMTGSLDVRSMERSER